MLDVIVGLEDEPKLFFYVDDIIIRGFTLEEHICLLQLFKNKANLTIIIDKCEFFNTLLKFLGSVVGSPSNFSLQIDPDKITSMINCPRPRNVPEVKPFVNM